MSDLAVGQTISLPDGRLGVIRFLGQTHFAAGDWVGVELEDDSGKNDGSVQGERYFDCPLGHGMFVRPPTLTILAQPAPQVKSAPAARKTGRPSSIMAPGAARGTGPSDPGLGKRMSLNAPSPSPGARTSRPSSIARSPTKSPSKSPTKLPGTAASSASNSRTATPSNPRVSSVGIKPRPSSGAARTSMGPPALPASKMTSARLSSASSAATRTSGAPSRTLSGRMSLATGRTAGRAESGRNTSGSSNGSAARGAGKGVVSPQKSDDEILSPIPTSPVHARTMALERLTNASPTVLSKPSPSTAASTSRPAASNAAARENEDLKAKIRVLERKRIEDRDKMKNLDKVQGERDKFENIIQKLQTKYQGQFQESNELKRLLKEAETRLESIESIQAEHESAMELATLDREMAEEMAEVLKAELDALKQKSEELELEVEILREENSEFSKGMTPEDRASKGWLQMERNNERLREALLRLRDITQQQEEELKDQIKSLEEDLLEFTDLKTQYEVAKESLSQAEGAVDDLRQQLDNALGAEDMIEDLTERNMSQSEQIEELKAIVEDLENLKEINDELEINHVQNEKEMQEELDFRDSVIAEQARRATQQDENLGDMEYTLSKFRELVTSLQGDLEDMRASHAVTETESEQLNSRSRAMMDLNMKLQISAAKAQVKTIDLELRRLEAQEAEQHLEIVKLFLPETYQADRDSVLALLRFKRLAFKSNLLNGFIKERVNGQPHPGHEDDVFAGCEAVDKLTWVTAMCDRFVSSISHCSLEDFAKYEGALYELEPVERALNGWIDGLRRDELKEKQCATELSRTIALMSHLAEVHIPEGLESFADDVHMRALLIQSHLESAAATFTTTKNMVQRVLPPGGDNDELAQHFAKRVDTVISQTRNAKVIAGKTVRALEDLKTRSLSLAPDTAEAFEQAETTARELADLARVTGLDLHKLLHEEGRVDPFTYPELQTCAHQSALNAAGSSESELFATYLGKLRGLSTQAADLAALSADLAQTQEFERGGEPWARRGAELRAQHTMPADAEEELRHLRDDYAEARRAAGLHEESLAVAQLKIETLESRMRDAGAKTARIAELEAAADRAQQQTTALKEDIEKQDRELRALEGDRDRWKKVAGDSSSRLAVAGGGEAAAAGRERAVATAREMDALRSEVEALQAAVRFLREDARRVRHHADAAEHAWLSEPLTRREAPPAEQRRNLLAAEGRDALAELVRLAGSAKVLDLRKIGGEGKDRLAWRPARNTPRYLAARQADEFAAWQGWRDEVVRKSRVLGTQTGSGEVGRQRGRARPVATLQIRLPGQEDGKTVGRPEVQIVGSREWEVMQGRLATV